MSDSSTSKLAKIAGTAALVGAGIGFAIATTLNRTKKRKQPGKVVLYTNPICPFAQRAWIAVLEKGIDVEYKYVPLSGELKKIDERKSTSDFQAWSRYTPEQVHEIKAEYKEKINPTGEVPTLVDDGFVVTESDIVSYYLDHKYPFMGTKLVPDDSKQVATMKRIYKIMSSSLIGKLYGLLKNQDPDLDEAIHVKIHEALKKIFALASEDGDYLLGTDYSYVDVMLAPFYDRFRNLLPYYRNRELFPSGKEGDRMRRWGKAVSARESFQKTSQTPEFYYKAYTGYAGARGRVTSN